jgi:hypothetical protein
MRLRDAFTIGLQIIALARSQWWTPRKIESFQKQKVIDALRYSALPTRAAPPFSEPSQGGFG